MELELAAAAAAGGGRLKRRQVDDQGGQGSAPVDRISALPDELRRRILTCLPLKDAIRTSALAQGWRDLWMSRRAHPTSCRDIHVLPGDVPSEVLASLEPRRRLDRFAVVVENHKVRPTHLKRLLAYAADSGVGDLRVDLRDVKASRNIGFNYRFLQSSRLLAHLSLRNLKISSMAYKRAPPFDALEAIRLDSVRMGASVNIAVLSLSPNLQTLDLRSCHSDRDGILCGAQPLMPPARAKSLKPPAGANLRSITLAECYGSAMLNCMVLPNLRSFCYSGRWPDSSFFLPKDAALTDLCICAHGSILPHRFNKSVPDDLSGLIVLTISSNVLKFFLWIDGEIVLWFKTITLDSLRELQLVVTRMQTHNLADIYDFFKACPCHNLERLFVQLPAFSDVPLEDSLQDAEVESQECLGNLRTVKVMNFNWRRFEVQLVSFLLRKATSLDKLLLVSPNVTPLNVPGVQEADLLLLNEALTNGLVIISESDSIAAAIQPLHSGVLSTFSSRSSIYC